MVFVNLRPQLLLLFCCAVEPSVSQEPVIRAPESAVQGQTVRIRIRDGSDVFRAAVASLSETRVPIFRLQEGTYLGLLPVSVHHKPGPYEVLIFDETGREFFRSPIEIRSADFPRQNIRVGKAMRALRPIPGELEAIQSLKDTVTAERWWREPFLKPTPDCISSVFGVGRYHNGEPTGQYHKGLDQRSPKGRPIRATAAGTVQIARMFGLHGGTVGLDHGQGVTSIYIHMSQLSVRHGQRVEKGQILGRVGSTGFATGPHLHWQIYVHGVPVNPVQWVQDLKRCS